MKRVVFIIMTLFMLVLLCACTKDKNLPEPDFEQLKSISELCTLECYYHNVAKIDKPKKSGIQGVLEKDRKLWFDYDGIVNIGVDFDKLDISVDENRITVTLPPAEILSVDFKEESFGDGEYIETSDGFFNKNPITPEDKTKALSIAQEGMQKTAESNESIMDYAQERAKLLIDNYIKDVGEAVGVEYEIKWILQKTETSVSEKE